MTETEGVGHPPTGWTDEDYDGFVADTFEIRPELAKYVGIYDDATDDIATYIAKVVSIEWDLWDGYIAHPETETVEMQLDDEVVAAVRRYLDRQ